MPLAIGIRRQILEIVGDEYTWAEVKDVPSGWCRRPDYLRAEIAGQARFNLDGSVRGDVTAGRRKEERMALAMVLQRCGLELHHEPQALRGRPGGQTLANQSGGPRRHYGESGFGPTDRRTGKFVKPLTRGNRRA